MPSYFITGKRGTGKSLFAAVKVEEYLKRGCKVATNLDFFLDKHFPENSRHTLIRLPDKPFLRDFESIGVGNATYDDDRNGLLLLDELGSWFNSRTWNEKGRLEVLEHFLYLRKLGWDVFLLVQDIAMVDKQLIASSAEHLVVCRSLAKVPIPFIGRWLRLFGLSGNLPKMHRAKVYLGESTQDLHVDTWTYTGKRHYRFYDTKQIFSSSYPHGAHSLLSPWHTKGRTMVYPRFTQLNLVLLLCAGFIAGALSIHFSKPAPVASPLPSFPAPAKFTVQESVFVVGTFSDGFYDHVLLSDSTSPVLTRLHVIQGAKVYQVGELYYKAKP